VRKFVIFLVYMAVISAVVYSALAVQPNIDEMFASLSSHTALPKTGSFVDFVSGHVGAILVFAPFVFLISSNVVAWLKYDSMAIRLTRLPRMAFTVGGYSVLAVLAALLVNRAVFEYAKSVLPPGHAIRLELQLVKPQDVELALYFVGTCVAVTAAALTWNAIMALENANSKKS